MKPSKLIKKTSPAALSEVRREITGKAFRQEHSTRDKKRLLKQIEEIEKIITRLGYQIKINKNMFCENCGSQILDNGCECGGPFHEEKYEIVTDSPYENNVWPGQNEFASVSEAENSINEFYRKGGRHDDPYASWIVVPK